MTPTESLAQEIAYKLNADSLAAAGIKLPADGQFNLSVFWPGQLTPETTVQNLKDNWPGQDVQFIVVAIIKK